MVIFDRALQHELEDGSQDPSSQYADLHHEEALLMQPMNDDQKQQQPQLTVREAVEKILAGR